MGRSKRIIENLEIVSVGAKGKAIARHEGKVILIKGAVPGDIADVKVIRKKKNYDEAKVLEFKKFSKYRTEPACKHFGVCGGCKWQHMQYEKQLYYKQNEVYENIRRIGKVEPKHVFPIEPSSKIYEYRNRLDFTFSNRRWLTDEEIKSGKKFDKKNALGFHLPGRFDRVINIEECKLQADISNQIRNFVKKVSDTNDWEYYDIKENKGFLRNLIIRTTEFTNQIMVIFAFAEYRQEEIEFLLSTLIKKFPEITTLVYFINDKLNDTLYDLDYTVFYGPGFIIEDFEGLKFKISPKSFFQTNSRQALNMYNHVKEYASLSGNEVVYDLYSGTGTISLYVAGIASKVVGIESVGDAVEDAYENARLNGIENAYFEVGDIKDIFSDEMFSKYGKPDVVITDPPRAGMHKNVVDNILKTEPKRIVYVSCNSATQARDIELLSKKYEVELIKPFDMFPHTYHVENIAVLNLKKS